MFLLPADDLSPNAPNDKVTHLLTFAALARLRALGRSCRCCRCSAG